MCHLNIFHWNHPEESWSTDGDWRYVLFPYLPFIKNCHWCHPHNQCGIDFSTGCHVAKIEHSSFLPDSDEFITRTIGRFDPLILLQQFLFGEANSHLGALLTESFMFVVHGSIFWLVNRPVSTWCIHIFAISHCNRPKQSIPVGLKFAKLQIHSSEVALPSSVGRKDLLQHSMGKRKWMPAVPSFDCRLPGKPYECPDMMTVWPDLCIDS